MNQESRAEAQKFYEKKTFSNPPEEQLIWFNKNHDILILEPECPIMRSAFFQRSGEVGRIGAFFKNKEPHLGCHILVAQRLRQSEAGRRLADRIFKEGQLGLMQTLHGVSHTEGGREVVTVHGCQGLKELVIIMKEDCWADAVYDQMGRAVDIRPYSFHSSSSWKNANNVWNIPGFEPGIANGSVSGEEMGFLDDRWRGKNQPQVSSINLVPRAVGLENREYHWMLIASYDFENIWQFSRGLQVHTGTHIYISRSFYRFQGHTLEIMGTREGVAKARMDIEMRIVSEYLRSL